jgi:16S rRNA (guanine1207-N2)-methyltransferase
MLPALTADEPGREPVAYPQEALLVECVAELAAIRPSPRIIVCCSAGLAQFASAAAAALSEATVSCTYLDLYRAALARRYCSDSLQNLRIQCAADFPTGDQADVAALPFSATGEAELTRDLLQSAHDRLRPGGKLYASTDNASDRWLGEQLRKILRPLEVRRFASGTLYVGTKTEPLKKAKNFVCDFAFRDRGRLIHACSRPGVFSHRSIDAGARRLIDAMEIETGSRVLDIGCGSGVVALAAACRADGVQVHAVDSNVRAVECTERGAELNGFTNLTTELNADGNFAGLGSYDLALANPPYYAGFRIARHFLTAGRASLRPGGRILVVTKRPDWCAEHMPACFDGIILSECRGYFLLHGTRPAN